MFTKILFMKMFFQTLQTSPIQISCSFLFSNKIKFKIELSCLPRWVCSRSRHASAETHISNFDDFRAPTTAQNGTKRQRALSLPSGAPLCQPFRRKTIVPSYAYWCPQIVWTLEHGHYLPPERNGLHSIQRN